MVAADGSKANGEVRGVRKRVVAVVSLGVAVLAGVLAFGLGRARSMTSPRGYANGGLIEAALPTAPRHQIYGDPVIVEEIEHGRTEAWLTNRLDQMLAWFAQPGKLMCPKGTDLRQSVEAFASATAGGGDGVVGASVPLARNRGTTESSANDDFGHAGRVTLPPVPISPADPREVRELKQIVNGMREELRAYLANGNGTPRSYWRRLLQRTQQEMQIYERTRRELEHEQSDAVWERKNDSMRLLGLRTIPKSDETE